MLSGRKAFGAERAAGNITDTSVKGLNRTFENAGTVNYTGNGLVFGYTSETAATLINDVGGVFNVNGDGRSEGRGVGKGNTLNGEGTFNKSGAADASESAEV